MRTLLARQWEWRSSFPLWTPKCRRANSPFKMPANRRRKSSVHNWRWPLRAILSHGETHKTMHKSQLWTRAGTRKHENPAVAHIILEETVPETRERALKRGMSVRRRESPVNFKFSKWSMRARRRSANRTATLRRHPRMRFLSIRSEK